MDVTNFDDIWKIVETVYKKNQVSLLYQKTNIPTEIALNNDYTISCKMSNEVKDKYVFLSCLFGTKEFVTTCEQISKEHKSRAILRPVRINIKEARSESSLLDKKVFVSNIINQNDIYKIINDDSIQKIIKENSVRLKHIFDYFNIVISERQDARNRLMMAAERPIFIPDKTDVESSISGFVPFNEYISSIKKEKDFNKYKSDICIPVKYRETVNIGYVQAQHSKKTDLNSFNLVNLIASSLKKEISDYSSYEESRELCRVLQLTHTGISFYHSPSRLYSKIFYLGGSVLLDLFHHNEKKATIRATINSLQATEKYYKIECTFSNLSLKQFEIIEEFVEKLG